METLNLVQQTEDPVGCCLGKIVGGRWWVASVFCFSDSTRFPTDTTANDQIEEVDPLVCPVLYCTVPYITYILRVPGTEMYQHVQKNFKHHVARTKQDDDLFPDPQNQTPIFKMTNFPSSRTIQDVNEENNFGSSFERSLKFCHF